MQKKDQRKGRRRQNKRPQRERIPFDKEAWQPKTELGRKVKSGEIKNVDEILDVGGNILEAEIIEVLFPDIKTELLLIGQSKGKFGGGARRIFRQTQKKTREGNKPRFATIAIAGNENGYIGMGYGKSKETVPAREKSLRNSKKNLMKIKRACGSWECGCRGAHTIPFKIRGKCGSSVIELMPAPKGTGLKIEKECAKILKMAGITDIWSKSLGKTKSKLNRVYACMNALKKIVETKVRLQDIENLGIVEGAVGKIKAPVEENGRED